MRPHRTDLISLTFGLVFLAAAGLWAVSRQIDLDAAAVGWFVVAGLIVLGAVGITHAIVSAGGRRHSDDQPQ